MDHHIYTYEEVKLKVNMRKSLTDYIIWARQFNVDLLANLPSIDKTIERFLKNQDSIGNCIRPFFGDTTADTFISLLKENTSLAIDMIKAIKDRDSTKEITLETDLTTNVENIATFLNTINPFYLREDLLDLFKTHLLLWKYQFIARMSGDYNADILYFDMGLHHILTISDCLFRGIIERFFEEQSAYSYQYQTQTEGQILEEQQLEQSLEDITMREQTHEYINQ